MSMLQAMMGAGGNDVLYSAAGTENAVQLETPAEPKCFTAIVGRLRVDPQTTQDGHREQLEDREVCQASIRCDAALVWVGKKVLVFMYTTGDASTHDGQKFVVQSVDSYRDGYVTVQLSRECVVDMRRQGYQGAT